jgi:hypothetical protein
MSRTVSTTDDPSGRRRPSARLDHLRRLTDRDRLLLSWLAEHYPLTTTQIAQALFAARCPRRGAHRHAGRHRGADEHAAGPAWTLASDPGARRWLHELPSNHGPVNPATNPHRYSDDGL